jgi:hypothetical protein
MVAAYCTKNISTQPKQSGMFLDPGTTLDPFEPLYLSGQPEYSPESSRLYRWAQELDQVGGKKDFEDKLDQLVFGIEGTIFGWYKAALSLWKIKLTKAWEASGRVLGEPVGCFKEFCEKHLGKTVSSVNSWIRAARSVSLLIAAGFPRLPKSVSIALELSKFSDDIVIDLWRDLIEKYPDHEISLQKMKEHLADPSQPKYKQYRLPIDAVEILVEAAAEANMTPTNYLTQLVKGIKQDDFFNEVSEEFREFSQGERVEGTDPSPQGQSPDNLADPPPDRDDLHHDDPDAIAGHDDGDLSKSPPGLKAQRSKPSRLKAKLAEYRSNPIKQKPAAPPFECQQCKTKEKLIACFNLANFSKVADRYFCEKHIEDSGYCYCGRWHSECNCQDLILEF